MDNSLVPLMERLRAEGKIGKPIARPTHFIDGSPIPDGYFDQLQTFFDAANTIYETYSGEELDQLERDIAND